MSQIPRLFIGEQPISEHATIALNEKQSHYLMRVLRLGQGKQVKLLGKSGQWLADISHADKKEVQLRALQQLCPYRPSPDIWLCFAPVKHEKIDVLAKRAVEMGVSALWPVQTAYTQSSRVNRERLEANLVEAAEQCSRMDVPVLHEYMPLTALLEGWDHSRMLLHADESGGAPAVHHALQGLNNGAKAAILIGPEGGFSLQERALLAQQPYVTPVSLGPRILRAETAALVGLAHMVAWLGDGDMQPHFVVDNEI